MIMEQEGKITIEELCEFNKQVMRLYDEARAMEDDLRKIMQVIYKSVFPVEGNREIWLHPTMITGEDYLE